MVFYEVVTKWSSVTEGSLTIDELNGALDEISKLCLKGEQRLLYVSYSTPFNVPNLPATCNLKLCSKYTTTPCLKNKSGSSVLFWKVKHLYSSTPSFPCTQSALSSTLQYSLQWFSWIHMYSYMCCWVMDIAALMVQWLMKLCIVWGSRFDSQVELFPAPLIHCNFLFK